MRLTLTSLMLIALAGCSPGPAPLHARESPAAAPPTSAPIPFAYAEADIADLQARMASGELDSVTLARAYLDRIARLDRAGPRLRAVIELNPDALREAAQLDAERRRGQLRGPLHGIPVLLKDNIGASPMSTTAGSLALEGFRPDDAFLVKRLRAAGALILGKTNLSEWANFRSSQSVSGWSARGGQTRNPYRLSHSPCGSSSGSAVAVSANLAVAAIGTETDGSIVCPAAVNGVVGLKPTVGLVSREGILPISFSQDTAGPMARSVADAAALLTAMAGRDEADPATATMPGRAVYDYTSRLNADGLRGARVGVLYGDLMQKPGIAPALQHAVAVLRDAGATVVPVQLPTQGQWQDAERIVLMHEFKAGLQRYFTTYQAPVRSLEDVIAWNRQHAGKELALFDQDLMETAAAMGGPGTPAYIRARSDARRLAGPEGIDAVLREQKLDALVAPTTGVAWPIRPGSGDDFPGESYSAAAVAGYPSLTVPMAHVNGLPLGLLFMGTAWSEPRLIELGYAYEQRTRARRPPRFQTDSLLTNAVAP
ncbi:MULTISPECIES: amidase [Stenotrophomonas]|jgi:amidase|uniref:amidase n=1 Tax=Stenotrophomonas TaxID=40323 RepID=UPI0004750267|nr:MULTISPECIES: amidase [Stenotrophomonas]MDX5515167.1 amidase [Stenotrophomonas sp. RG-453]OFS94017.1 amidase [Stenotrophomonas sp. HMSC10F06]WIA60471.1 amidase [Stenotrophomonas sp. BIO128-Bstrain]